MSKLTHELVSYNRSASFPGPTQRNRKYDGRWEILGWRRFDPRRPGNCGGPTLSLPWVGWDRLIKVGILKPSQEYPWLIAARQGKIDKSFEDTYEELCEIRNQLERLSLTQAWSLRETDLYDYQRRLDRIDESRINGNFEDVHGNKADIHSQRVWAKPRFLKPPLLSWLTNCRHYFILFDEVMRTSIS